MTSAVEALKPNSRTDGEGDEEDGEADPELLDEASKRLKLSVESLAKRKSTNQDSLQILTHLSQVADMLDTNLIFQRMSLVYYIFLRRICSLSLCLSLRSFAFILSFRAQAAIGKMSQDLHDLKETVALLPRGGLVSAGRTPETAIAVEPQELPPKVHRSFTNGVLVRLLSDPTQQVTGQNKKENIRTFSIASKPVADGVSAARKVLQDTMPLAQANLCMDKYTPKQGVSGI